MIDFVILLNNMDFASKEEFANFCDSIKNNTNLYASFCNKIYFVVSSEMYDKLSFCENVFDSIYKIPSLNDNFLLFEEPKLFKKHVKEVLFFKDGLPRDMMYFEPIVPDGSDSLFSNLDNIGILNKNYVKNNCINKRKYFLNRKYGIKVIWNNFFLNFFDAFIGFKERKTPIPTTKKMLYELKEKELDFSHCFNEKKLNINLLRYLQLATLSFSPFNYKKIEKYLSNFEVNKHE